MSVIEEYEQRVKAGALVSDAGQIAALQELDRIYQALTAPQKRGWFANAAPPPKGLYLWGGVGRGKSMLMDLFVAQMPKGTRRVHFHAFMQEVHQGMKAARAKGADDALRPVADDLARGLKCLAFDEMQITDITDAMIVGRLFEQLWGYGVVIVATSNRVPDDLYKDGLNRALFLPFINMIKNQMVVHEIASPTDYRQDRLSGRQMYFTPIGQQATAGLDALWDDLAGGPGAPLDLHVAGRTVRIPAFRNGVARTDFKSLCGTPLGPADYLAMAEAVKVLLLDDIPILSAANNNEAKRFVTLIDALYEAHVQFAATADATPQNLYPKGAGSFEFERTASRLLEMQSDGWGA